MAENRELEPMGKNELRAENEAEFETLLDGPVEYETYNLGLQL